MAASSNEFAALVNKLQKTPNDPALKEAVVRNLPKMLALAQDNPLALYHLAHIYHPNSSQYKQTMRQSANLGCTSAMLVMCQILAKTGDANDLKNVAYYLGMINKSNDSFIKEQAQALMFDYPQLARIMQEGAKPKLYHSNIYQFFTPPQLERETENQFFTPPQHEKETEKEDVEAIACKV